MPFTFDKKEKRKGRKRKGKVKQKRTRRSGIRVKLEPLKKKPNYIRILLRYTIFYFLSLSKRLN